MTEKYLKRKRLSLNKFNVTTNDESVNLSTYTTFNEFNNHSCKNTNDEQEKENLKENSPLCALLPLEENEDNNFSNDLYKGYYTNKENIIFNNLLERPSIEENVDDDFSFGQASPLDFKNLIDLRLI